MLQSMLTCTDNVIGEVCDTIPCCNHVLMVEKSEK
jgi:hypothetical protein